ncbi:MAG: transporter substrate-binding domain-containing protein, partial [Bryobacteraceae bacterium]
MAAARRSNDILRVGVAGTEPFVVKTTRSLEGISVEIWQAMAAQAGWRYKLLPYADVPQALNALFSGDLDLVVGPVSITAERTRYARFSQPYFESSLSILAPTAQPSVWQR